MLEQDQAAIAATLLHGPAHLPSALFDGDNAAKLRGLKIHANTISHARLVALEDTFSWTRGLMGEALFNQWSRRFLEAGGAKGRAPAQVGEAFPAFLEACDDPVAADVARVEWVWLQSYHAADQVALTLADLADMDEASLLALPVACHPAAVVVSLTSAAALAIDPAFSGDCRALLITRPEAEVQMVPATAVEAEALMLAKKSTPLGNLIALMAEQHDEGADAIGSFIATGALRRAEG